MPKIVNFKKWIKSAVKKRNFKMSLIKYDIRVLQYIEGYYFFNQKYPDWDELLEQVDTYFNNSEKSRNFLEGF